MGVKEEGGRKLQKHSNVYGDMYDERNKIRESGRKKTVIEFMQRDVYLGIFFPQQSSFENLTATRLFYVE